MYKYLSMLLFTLMVGGGIAYGVQAYQWKSQRKELNNSLAKVQKTQQETETARSRLALQIADLKANNKDLQKVIDDRDEQIVAKTEAEIKWKNRYFKSINATQMAVKQDGVSLADPATVDPPDVRFRVDFEHNQDPYKITGHTLTNPAYAEVKLEWTRGLKLELILTKNDDDSYRVYLDSENGDLLPATLNLQVDPTVFEKRWYQRLGISSNLSFGKHGGILGLMVLVDLTDKWFVGPNFSLFYDGTIAKTFYGVSAGWYPFK